MRLKRLFGFLPKKAFKAAAGIFFKAKYKDSVVVMVDGGLASQIWKAVFGGWLSEKLGCKVFFDTTWFETNGKDIKNLENRSLVIKDVFPSIEWKEPERGMMRALQGYRRYSNPRPHLPIDDRQVKVSRYYDGYYMNAAYFEQQKGKVRERFVFSESIRESPRSKLHGGTIGKSKNPVAVHIRRGDYVDSIHDVLTPQYYARAIEEIKNRGAIDGNLSLFLFTNDESYVRQHIVPLLPQNSSYEIICGGDSNSAVDMYLMSICKHFIISNSGFSWIPAWINPNPGKLVIMPMKWYAAENPMTEGSDTAFYYPSAIPIRP